MMILLLSASAAMADWKGEVVVEEGIKHVKDPAEPLHGQRDIVLRELWRISADDEDMVGLIADVCEGRDGNIFLLAVQLNTVWVYSSDGERIGSIGREGDGPGEFRSPFQVLQWPDGRLAVAESFPAKFHVFCANGDLGETVDLQIKGRDALQSPLVLEKAQVVGQFIAVEFSHRTYRENTSVQSLNLGFMDAHGNLVHRILDRCKEINLGKKTIRPEQDIKWLENRWATRSDGLIFAALGHQGYAIKVFDLDGEERMVIEREYESVRRNDEERQLANRPYEKVRRHYPNLIYEISDFQMDIEGIHVTDSDCLWVQTSRGRWRLPESALAGYDVFNSDGYFVEQVVLYAQGNPENDLIFLLNDRVVVSYEFWTRAYAMGGVNPRDKGEDAEGVDAVVVCYSFSP